MRAARVLAIALLLGGACKKREEAPESPDAAAPSEAPRAPIRVEVPEIGLSLVAPETWIRAETLDRGLAADLRRPAPAGVVTLAPPRLVVRAAPSEGPVDVERAVERELGDMRAVQAGGSLSIARTTRGRRLLGGVDMGELRVEYRVVDAKGGPDAPVVHRVWVGARAGADGKPWEVLFLETHLFTDEEWVARELEDVLRSINFAAPGEPGEHPQ